MHTQAHDPFEVLSLDALQLLELAEPCHLPSVQKSWLNQTLNICFLILKLSVNSLSPKLGHLIRVFSKEAIRLERGPEVLG